MSPDPCADPQAETLRTSVVLRRLLDSWHGDDMPLSALLVALGERSFGLVLFLLALPNAIGLATIPGLSTVVAVPMAVLALQVMAGAQRPWLPRWLAERRLRRTDVALMLDKALPWLERIERIVRPRLPFLTGVTAERLLGLVIFLFAVVLALPIPGGNLLPGVAVALLALGLIEQDGLCVLAGLGVSVVAVGVLVLVFEVAVAGLDALWHGLIG